MSYNTNAFRAVEDAPMGPEIATGIRIEYVMSNGRKIVTEEEYRDEEVARMNIQISREHPLYGKSIVSARIVRDQDVADES